MKMLALSMVLALAATFTAFCYSGTAQHAQRHGEREITEGNTKCLRCNGTGFNGNLNCPQCKGTGRIGY